MNENEKSIYRRVRLYILNTAGQWEERGTGHISCEPSQTQPGWYLVMNSEDDNKLLLESRILSPNDKTKAANNSDEESNNNYQRQGDTLILWHEPSTGDDLALSFQEPQGCTEIWEEILQVQDKLLAEEQEQDQGLSESYFKDGQEDGKAAPGQNKKGRGLGKNRNSASPMQLPEPSISTLSDINDIISEVTPSSKERLVLALLHDKYLNKLIDVFDMCEDVNDLQSLRLLFNIFKNLVLLNDTNVFAYIFADDFIMKLMGTLEYDPEVPVGTRAQHRKYLEQGVVFREVVPIRDEETRVRVHQNYKLTYLKESVMPRLLDDHTFATLNSIIFLNNVDIVTSIYKDPKFLAELFDKLQKPLNKKEFLHSMQFLQELCNLAKNLQMVNKANFYRTLKEQGFFQILEEGIVNPSAKIRQISADILTMCLSPEANLLRTYINSQNTNQTTKNKFFRNLISQLTAEKHTGVQDQICEILKLLLEHDSSATTQDFLNNFYDEFMDMLVKPIKFLAESSLQTAETNNNTNNNPAETQAMHTVYAVLEILTMCVCDHAYRSKFYLLKNNVIQPVVQIATSSPQTHIKLGCIRFIRAIISKKDEFFYRYLIKNNIFEKLVHGIFTQNIDKYNLVNSATIELFELIRKENIKSLIVHLVQKFRDIFTKITYVDTFQGLIEKYDQYQEFEVEQTKPASQSSAGSAGTAGHKRSRGWGDDDDSYFFSEDSEEVSSSTSATSVDSSPQDKKMGDVEIGAKLALGHGLVDYDDDDDSLQIHSAAGPVSNTNHGTGAIKQIKLKVGTNSNLTNNSSPETTEASPTSITSTGAATDLGTNNNNSKKRKMPEHFDQSTVMVSNGNSPPSDINKKIKADI